MPLSHKSVLWSRTVGCCFSKLKIKDAAIPMANENEILILVQKCLGKKWFLADKRKLEMEQADCGPISFNTHTHSSCIFPTGLLWISLLKFKTLSSIHCFIFIFFSSPQLAPYLLKRTCWPARLQTSPLRPVCASSCSHCPCSDTAHPTSVYFSSSLFSHLCFVESRQVFRIKMCTAATTRSCMVSTLETDCWLAICFVS